MQIVPVEEKEIPKREVGRMRGTILTPLLEFMELSVKSGKMILDEGRKAGAVQSSIIADAKKYHLPIKVIRRGDDIFVVRNDL